MVSRVISSYFQLFHGLANAFEDTDESLIADRAVVASLNE